MVSNDRLKANLKEKAVWDSIHKEPTKGVAIAKHMAAS